MVAHADIEKLHRTDTWCLSCPHMPLHLLCRAQNFMLPEYTLQTQGVAAGSIDTGLVAHSLAGLNSGLSTGLLGVPSFQ